MSEVINGTQTIVVPAGDVAEDLQRGINRATHDAWQEGHAQGIKDAKPRTIDTVEELNGLPVGSVMLDRDGDAWQRYRTGWTCTDRSTNTADQPSSSLAWVLAPATVLYEPGTGQ